MDIDYIRGEIPACRDLVYLNTGWSGPSPTVVVNAIKDRLEYESYSGPTSPPVQESAREIDAATILSVADLLGVSSEEVCLTQNTTDGLNIVVNGLQWKDGDEIITFGPEHSSVLMPALSLRRRLGIEVKILPLSADEDPALIVDRVRDAITGRTKLLLCSHIQYTSGLRMPVEGLRRVTKERGVRMLLDGAQTGGHIALDLRAMDCDFYSIPSQKWLLGPDGVGALYIKHDVLPEVIPVRVSGRAALSHDDIGNYEPNDNEMRKFQLTTHSSPLAAGFNEAIKFVLQNGMSEVEARAVHLSNELKQSLSDIDGVTVTSSRRQDIATGLTAFRIRGLSPDEGVRYLWEHHNIVSRQVREIESIRVSTHFFNSDGDISTLIDAVGGMAR